MLNRNDSFNNYATIVYYSHLNQANTLYEQGQNTYSASVCS